MTGWKMVCVDADDMTEWLAVGKRYFVEIPDNEDSRVYDLEGNLLGVFYTNRFEEIQETAPTGFGTELRDQWYGN